MKSLVSTVDLLNRMTGLFVEAELYSGLDDKNLTDFESQWLPLLAKKLQHSTPQELAAAQAQDARWNWRKKELAWGQALSYQAFAVEADTVTQGLMYVSKLRYSRLAGQLGAPVIYVEAIATAPWNRPGFSLQPKYKGVGQVLMQAAISLSIDEEFKARVALHALPQSETWYRTTLSMTDLGPDPDDHNMRYFELTTEQAMNLIR
jgi:hypothetical protein